MRRAGRPRRRGAAAAGTTRGRPRPAELVVLRSTWDYTHRVRRLPRLGARTAAGRQPGRGGALEHRQAVPARPRRGRRADRADVFRRRPAGRSSSPAPREYVLKPSVGAGSRGAGRFTADRADAARDHAAELHAAGPHRAGPALPRRGRHRRRDGAGLLRRRVQPRDRQGARCCRPATRTRSAAGRCSSRSRSPPASRRPRSCASARRRCRRIRARFGADQLYARVDLLPSPGGPRGHRARARRAVAVPRLRRPARPTRLAAAIAARA